MGKRDRGKGDGVTGRGQRASVCIVVAVVLTRVIM